MRWLWIDCIIKYEADKQLVAIKNVSLSENYLHDYIIDGKAIMPFSLIIEGMAQTAGILVGSSNKFKEKVILAKIGKAKLDSDVTAGDTVRFEATIDRIDESGAATGGFIDRRVAGGDAWELVSATEVSFDYTKIDDAAHLNASKMDILYFQNMMSQNLINGVRYEAELEVTVNSVSSGFDDYRIGLSTNGGVPSSGVNSGRFDQDDFPGGSGITTRTIEFDSNSNTAKIVLIRINICLNLF